MEELVGEFVFGASALQKRLCAFSIIGQCIVHFHGREVIWRLAPDFSLLKSRDESVRSLAMAFAIAVAVIFALLCFCSIRS